MLQFINQTVYVDISSTIVSSTLMMFLKRTFMVKFAAGFFGFFFFRILSKTNEKKIAELRLTEISLHLNFVNNVFEINRLHFMVLLIH